MTLIRKVLIIDDEIQLRRLLRLALQGKNYEVFEAESGAIGLSEAAYRQVDVILLDLGLPDMDGLEVLKRIREWSDVPILILSARDEEDAKVIALETGADDYVTKPFSSAELVARLYAIQRRQKVADEPLVELEQLRIDFTLREVSLAGAEVKLTPTEYGILKLLAQNAGKILTQRQILHTVWGVNALEQSQYLRVYITHLRKKILGSGMEIRNEPGIGYRLQKGD